MRALFYLTTLFFACTLHAEPSQTELAVWVNEAIVSTYTVDYQHYRMQQKKIAHYFTAKAWMAYLNALTASKLEATLESNKFESSAVAQSTPTIILKSPGLWEANMPVLVVYKNKLKEIKQTLLVTIFFKATAGDGTRGLSIESFQSVVQKPVCECDR